MQTETHLQLQILVSFFLENCLVWLKKLTWKNRYIPLETAVIFFLANLFLKHGIISEYVIVDFIWMKEELQNEKFLSIAGLELTAPDSQV